VGVFCGVSSCSRTGLVQGCPTYAGFERHHRCAFGEPTCTWFGGRSQRRRLLELGFFAIALQSKIYNAVQGARHGHIRLPSPSYGIFGFHFLLYRLDRFPTTACYDRKFFLFFFHSTPPLNRPQPPSFVTSQIPQTRLLRPQVNNTLKRKNRIDWQSWQSLRLVGNLKRDKVRCCYLDDHEVLNRAKETYKHK